MISTDNELVHALVTPSDKLQKIANQHLEEYGEVLSSLLLIDIRNLHLQNYDMRFEFDLLADVYQNCEERIQAHVNACIIYSIEEYLKEEFGEQVNIRDQIGDKLFDVLQKYNQEIDEIYNQKFDDDSSPSLGSSPPQSPSNHEDSP
ncbi:hypothetical protein [Tuwongella immobilis]|uniref:Uncharacterized protein n=1 Tax=Tuwongella immobilis TaxID=692036 RepID=A0A6C2YR63_9BACT|nr:hypothetical protein [Tuwongella immobilis]VIP03649.1 unnamed protein product [Tuwongella immobilis]VTS04666.1 unnamed protein product [Tuwongella immobilis]